MHYVKKIEAQVKKGFLIKKTCSHGSHILSNENPLMFNKMKYLQNQLKLLTESNREIFCLHSSKKLVDPMTSGKTYWSILKTLLNNKMLCIPPLYYQNKQVRDFKRKSDLFHCFFAKQYSVINNPSEFPFNLCENQTNLFQQSLSIVMTLQD